MTKKRIRWLRTVRDRPVRVMPSSIHVFGKTYSGLAGEPRLWDFYDYPELFLVDYNFCAQK